MSERQRRKDEAVLRFLGMMPRSCTNLEISHVTRLSVRDVYSRMQRIEGEGKVERVRNGHLDGRARWIIANG